MKRNLYLTNIEQSPGKSFVSMGIASLLKKSFKDFKCYKLFAEEDIEQFKILQEISGQKIKTFMPLNQAISLLRTDPEQVLGPIYEAIDLNSHALSYFEGSDFQSDNDAVEYQFNLNMAWQLNCDVIIVVSAFERTKEHVASLIQNALEIGKKNHARISGIIINRVDNSDDANTEQYFKELFRDIPMLCLIPNIAELAWPTVSQVAAKLDASYLCGYDERKRPVVQYTVAAKNIGNFLKSRLDRKDMMIITPDDRVDILLGSMLADQSSHYPKIAGIVLTGGETPEPVIMDIISGLENPFPVLLTKLKTFETATALYGAKFSLNHDDTDRIDKALHELEPWLRQGLMDLLQEKSVKALFSPAVFLHDLIHKARAKIRHMILPEGEDLRILTAASHLIKRKAVRLTIIGNVEKIESLGKKHQLDLSGIQILDISHLPKKEQYANKYLELRKHKDINLAIAQERMNDVNYYAAMMVYFGDADGMISGATHTTADTVRPALEIIKTKPGVSRVSSVFIMCLPEKIMIYGDCAINPEPDAHLLAEIAEQAANMAKSLNIPPKVALLSYSSGSSGKGLSVTKVSEAKAIIDATKPDYIVEGPLQYDAAVDPDVAKSKMPDSKLKGQANVLIFPDLNTGNNTYKAVQRESNALAIGPVLLGLNRPVNDLSRGCTIADVINTIIITAILAQKD